MSRNTKFRRVIVFALVMILIATLAPGTLAASSTASTSSSIKLIVNGQEVKPDVPPQLINDRTMVPVRWVAEALGAIVEWDDAKRAVLINSSTIPVTAAAPNDPIRLFVAGKEIKPDVEPQMINDRVMVPVRWVAEAMGAIVGWDDPNQTVIISKTKEMYGYKRQIVKSGNVVLELEPDELFIMTKNIKTYEYSADAREKLIGQYIRKAFPDLKFRIVNWDDNGIREQDFQYSGVYPDLIMELPDRNTTRVIKTYGMEYDLTPLIKKYNFDLNRINQASMNIVRDRGTGAIYSIPFEIDDYVLYYNKKFFNARNEPYPTAGMTYDQAYEKAKRMTYQDGTRMIKGWSQHPDQYMKLNQYGYIPFSLTEPNKVVLANDNWLKLANNIRRFYEIQGNVWSTTDNFFRDGIVAMCVDNLSRLPQIAGVKEYLKSSDYKFWTENSQKVGLTDWDIAPIPVFPDASNKIYQPNTNAWFITKQSLMKETAFKVIAYLLSDEVQLGRARDGIKGVINTPQIAASFGANIPEYKNLNLQAVYWGENAAPPVRSPQVAGGGYWDISLWDIFRKYIFQYGLTTDAALLRVEQEQNQWIQDQIAQGKKW